MSTYPQKIKENFEKKIFPKIFPIFWVMHHLNSTFRCVDNYVGVVIFENIVRCVDNNHKNSSCPHIVVVR